MDCKTFPLENYPFGQQVQARLIPEDMQFFARGGKGHMEQHGWVRFTDDRPADLWALLLFADAFPRVVAMRTGIVGWIPTLDMTVQCLARPAPGYIGARFSTRVLAGGVLEEQGELWDSDGQLVAVCRQSAVLRLPEERQGLLD